MGHEQNLAKTLIPILGLATKDIKKLKNCIFTLGILYHSSNVKEQFSFFF